jgi:hypothetical protein
MPIRQPARLDPENYKDEKFEDRAAYDEDPGEEQDPLPHHKHSEAKDGDDEVVEVELDDMAELAEDDLAKADGPVG